MSNQATRSPASLRIFAAFATLQGADDSLQSLNTFELPDGALAMVRANSSLYQLDTSSTEAPDGATVIQPSAGRGRWLVLSTNASGDSCVSVKVFGAKGDGVTDDTAAIQATINAVSVAGGIVCLPPGTYLITTTLTVPSNVTIQGAGIGISTIYMPAASFTNTVAGTYSATSVAINCSGQTSAPFTPTENITLRDFTIESQVSDGRHLYPILVRNSLQLNILHVDGFGIPAGNLITLDSVINGEIAHCYLRACSSSSASSVQLTGIETGNNRVNSVNCRDLDIHDNTIEDLTFSGAALPTPNMQTDGINTGVGSAHGHNIHDNYIRNVGEGIDCFSSECEIHGNELVDCQNAGIKLIHGASSNHIYGNTITRPELAGLYMGDSDSAASENNYWHDNLISDVAANNVWGASAPSAILIDDNARPFKCNNNTFRDNKILGGGTNMDYAIRQGSGTNNRFYDNEAEAFAIAYSVVSAGTATIQNAKKAFVRVGLDATQATAAGVAEVVEFEIEEIDTQGEFNTTTHVYTATSPRRISVAATVRAATGGAGENWLLRIRKNGTMRAESSAWSGGSPESLIVDDVFTVEIGDTVDIEIFQNNGARNIGGSPVGSYLTIEEVAS